MQSTTVVYSKYLLDSYYSVFQLKLDSAFYPHLTSREIRVQILNIRDDKPKFTQLGPARKHSHSLYHLCVPYPLVCI